MKIFVYINSELNNCWEYDDISKLIILYSIDFWIMIIVLILQFVCVCVCVCVEIL